MFLCLQRAQHCGKWEKHSQSYVFGHRIFIFAEQQIIIYGNWLRFHCTNSHGSKTILSSLASRVLCPRPSLANAPSSLYFEVKDQPPLWSLLRWLQLVVLSLLWSFRSLLGPFVSWFATSCLHVALPMHWGISGECPVLPLPLACPIARHLMATQPISLEWMHEWRRTSEETNY